MPYHKRASGGFDLIAGFVGVIGPDNNPNYFTGCGYSGEIDEAKVFRTARGCFSAMRHWQEADYNESRLGDIWWDGRRAAPVKMGRLDWEIVPG